MLGAAALALAIDYVLRPRSATLVHLVVQAAGVDQEVATHLSAGVRVDQERCRGPHEQPNVVDDTSASSALREIETARWKASAHEIAPLKSHYVDRKKNIVKNSRARACG